MTIFNWTPSVRIFERAVQPSYFIAMEYKGLLNCIYKVYVTDSLIMGARVNGYIVCGPNLGIGTTIPMRDIRNPAAYVNKKMDQSYADSLRTDEPKFLKRDKANFIVHRSEVKKIWYDPSHKWGMGYYPDHGKIYLESPKTTSNKEIVRELILVGDQNPDFIMSLLVKG
ncbi:MAG TPA: hypothetical protein VK563_15830 [Puia sp.]|nr:hypothetical protein [Puia sp.]